MDYKRWERSIPVCLECGDKIKYGRTDKKFCSDDCRNRHHNEKQKESRAYRRKVLAILAKNYDLLDALIKMGVDSADFANLVTAVVYLHCAVLIDLVIIEAHFLQHHANFLDCLGFNFNAFGAFR